MKLIQHWLIRNNICSCGLLWHCKTICDLRNAEREREHSTVVHGFSTQQKHHCCYFLANHCHNLMAAIKNIPRMNADYTEMIVSQSGFYDMALCKSCKMQLAINSVWVQVQTWGPNTQPLIKEFPLCDLMTVCLHHYSYLWTNADTNCPGAEQIMACFTETKRPN